MWFYSLKQFKQTKTYPPDYSHFILSSNSVSFWLMLLHWAVHTGPGCSHFCVPCHQCLEASNQAIVTYVEVIHKVDAQCRQARCWLVPGWILNLWSTDVLSYMIGNSEPVKVDPRRDHQVRKLLPSFLAIGGPWRKLISFLITGIQEDQDKQKAWAVARIWLSIVKMTSNDI